MLKSLRTLSLAARFIFYGMMAYFLVLVIGVISGSYRFTATYTGFYYMVAASGVAAASLLLQDLHHILVKRKARSGSHPLDRVEEDDHASD